ncbi:MAG: hypothetical protein V2I45_02055 [Halieaceae bacterium]|nr:hypothetical protein [Halieaceae bacterium]
MPRILGENEALALAVDAAIRDSLMDGWRDNAIKLKRVRRAIRGVLEHPPASAETPKTGVAEDGAAPYNLDAEINRILDLAKHQHDY